jgi:hypothetical protein
VNIRLEERKLCLLVMIGVRADGRKELSALADGHRESAESWADPLRDCALRGMRALAGMGNRGDPWWTARQASDTVAFGQISVARHRARCHVEAR